MSDDDKEWGTGVASRMLKMLVEAKQRGGEKEMKEIYERISVKQVKYSKPDSVFTTSDEMIMALDELEDEMKMKS